MSSAREAFREGARDVAPLVLGAIPFGTVFGVTAVEVGLSPPVAVGMSLAVFAGASQLAALQLIAVGAAPLVVIATALVINLRFSMYSAALARSLGPLPLLRKIPLAYMLSDQAYAVSAIRFDRDEPVDRPAYFLGAALALWTAWQLSTIAGAVLGQAVPDAWELEFAVPLTFLALLVSGLRDRPAVVAAGVGGAVAALGAALPSGLGIIAAAACGIAAGVAAERVLR